MANIIAWATILALFGCAVWWDRKAFQKPTIFNICLIALFCALIFVLDNIVSIFIPLGKGIKLQLGYPLLVVIGMLLGPYYAVLTGVASDTLGLIYLGGAYSALFTLDNVLMAFMGSVMLGFNLKKYWIPWSLFCFIVTFSFVSLGIDSLYLYIFFGLSYLKASFIFKLIKLPLEIVIYYGFASFLFYFLYFNLMEHMIQDCWVLDHNNELKPKWWQNFWIKIRSRLHRSKV